MEAAYAKSGVLLDGTPSNYLSSQTETDQLNIERADQRSQIERRNILYEGQLQANEYMNQAQAYKDAAQSTIITGYFSSASAGLGAYSSAGGTFSWSESSPDPVQTQQSGLITPEKRSEFSDYSTMTLGGQ